MSALQAGGIFRSARRLTRCWQHSVSCHPRRLAPRSPPGASDIAGRPTPGRRQCTSGVNQGRQLSLLGPVATGIGKTAVLLRVRTIDARVEHLSKLGTGLVTALPSLGRGGEREGAGLAAGRADGRRRAHEWQA
jgi:hypothetical protein